MIEEKVRKQRAWHGWKSWL